MAKKKKQSKKKRQDTGLTPEQESQCKAIHKEKGWPQNMIRFGFKAGFIQEQIRSFGSAESLHAAIGRIKPSILASAGVPSEPKPAPPPVEMEEKTAVLLLYLSPIRAKTPLRAEDEHRDIDAFLNRRGIRSAVTKMEIVRYYKPGPNNKYLTEVTIYYEGVK